MKKLLTTSLALFAGVAAANAQSLIAGWSFTNVTPVGASIQADLSDPLFDGGLSAITSAIYFDGSFGSTDIANNGGNGVVYNGIDGAGLVSSADILTRPSAQDFQAGGSLDDALVLDNYTVLPLGNFVFEINTGDGPYNTWSFQYAAGASGDGVTLDWAWSLDGASWLALGSDLVATSDEAGGFSGFGADAATLYLRATPVGFALDNGGGEQLTLDNFAVYGTAVPEPGTFAAIAGVLALGLAAYRRRRG